TTPLVTSRSIAAPPATLKIARSLPLEPDTPAWFAELSTLSSFRFVGKLGRFTAHREVERLPRAAWRAHRSMRSHTYDLHLGSTATLTIATLEQAAATLHTHLK